MDYWGRIFQGCDADYTKTINPLLVNVCGFWPSLDVLVKKPIKPFWPLITTEKNLLGKDVNTLKLVIPQDPDPQQCQAVSCFEHDASGVWHQL